MAGVLFKKILVPIDFSPCSEEAFRIAVSLARLFQAEVVMLHVIDTKSLETLNRLGLASATEEKAQKKRLGHHARLNFRRLLLSDEAIARIILREPALLCGHELGVIGLTDADLRLQDEATRKVVSDQLVAFAKWIGRIKNG